MKQPQNTIKLFQLRMLETGPVNQWRAVMGYATGSEKRTEMAATHMTATQPTTIPYLPRLNGPATKVLRDSVTLKKIGNAYAMYSPIVAMDTIAWNATIFPSDCQF